MNNIVFIRETGEVRLVLPRGQTQLLFRLTADGLILWCKRFKKEILIPWEQLEGWKSPDSTS